MSRTLRAVVATAVVAVIAVIAAIEAPDVAGAVPRGDDEPATTVTIDEGTAENMGRSIPLPNRGVEPEKPGDRGGWQQVLVFGLIIGGLAAVGFFAYRDAKKSQARAAAARASDA